jgi:DNA-binding NarL/FixJ family response regulator
VGLLRRAVRALLAGDLLTLSAHHGDIAGVRVTPYQRGGESLAVISYPLRRPASFSSLTASELEVVEAVLDGQSQREIATQRGRSSRTIANQLASAYRKLSVRGAAELAVLVQGNHGERGPLCSSGASRSR